MVGPFGAFPPVFLVRPGYDLIWGYPFVLSGMQLRGYVGVVGQGIGDRNLFTGTTWAATTVEGPIRNERVPFVVWAFRADPPIFFSRAGDNLFCSEAVVLSGMQLGGYFWVANAYGWFSRLNYHTFVPTILNGHWSVVIMP